MTAPDLRTEADRNFITLNLKEVPLSIYLVRNSILTAVRKTAHLAKGTVVDLGCGVMPYKNEFTNRKTIKYIGIDIRGSQYHNKVQPDLYWDGQTIPMADSSVDFLIATEFLEHYFNTNHILSEIRRVLTPNGTIFFTVPHIWPIHEPPYDYHRFTPFTLRKHLEEAGFTEIEINALGGHNYFLGIAAALWCEANLSHRQKRIFLPIIKRAIVYLIRRDKPPREFSQNQMFSGLFGIARRS